uniref:Replication protein A 70 kDa DNA-binding subunit B/D first OB fold domain-containing protein n=1 Tax=Brassica oleracea var. oleracea TaxID=109376 RepID=A0A0D3CRU1_BRAOL
MSSPWLEPRFNQLLENVSLCLSNSSNRHLGVRRSTFESLRLGRSSQSIASGFFRFWDSLNFKKEREFVGITVLFLDEKVNSVIHGCTPVRRANHYMSSLKAGSIVKVDRFEVSRCSSMYKITDHSFLIGFISLTIIDEVIMGAPEIIMGAPEINLLSRLDCSTISK